MSATAGTPAFLETAINVLAEGTRLEGVISFEHVFRIHGTLVGEIRGRPGSTLIVGEAAVVEGAIHADRLLVDGYVQGEVRARTGVVVSRTGRVIGDIHSPSLKLEFGSYFEGRSVMESGRGPTPVKASP
jgi:cytoskeletal protein CcmA (bactofilin family)